MTKIKLAKTDRTPSVDRNGFVFHWGDRIFRAIYPDKEKSIRELFDCGLIDELVENNLFPQTTQTDYTIDECSLVLEHKKISPVLLPENWSFEMHKDACLCLLKVNKIASTYGYTTIDSHGLNILFSDNTPMFIDLGSFIKSEVIKPGKVKGWRGLHEFMQRMYLPLKLKSIGWQFNNDEICSLSTIGAYLKHPVWARLLNPNQYRFFENVFYNYKMIHQIPNEMIIDYLKYTPTRRLLAKFILFGKRWNLFPFTSLSFSKLEKKISAIRKKNVESAWGRYHDKLENNPRFEEIIRLLKELPDCNSVLELGGNAGAFSKLIARNTVVQQIICTDYDTNAIDKLYDYVKTNNETRIKPAIVSVNQELMRIYSPSSEERFYSDIAFALAITHHLFLTQGLSPDFVFNFIKKHSKKYVAIEFMPLGLYTPKYNDTLTLPDWYSEEWFVDNFKKHFSLSSRTVLEKNRILYIGEIL